MAARQRAKAGFFRRAVRVAGRLLLWFALISLGWTVTYRFLPIPFTWPMARDVLAGHHVSRGHDDRFWVPLDDMSPALARSVIAAEDSRFCSHRGFDFEAIEKAAAGNAAGKTLRGASTISQQTAKNAFLWPGRSYIRKALEAWFTMLIEIIWGKPRIMEVYLNIAEMGPGIYGAEAAARHYFGKSAARLTANEAARLAAVLPQPLVRNAGRPGPYVRRHARTIERRAGVVARDGLDACLLRNPAA
jgi:monofunctional biosynthetic peptidoglycan transglycosylase